MPIPRLKNKVAAAPDPVAVEEAVFQRKRAQLLRRYPGEFVAIYRGRVVGHGPDDEELARRMFAKLGDAPFYIAHLASKPAVYEFPSPETDR